LAVRIEEKGQYKMINNKVEIISVIMAVHNEEEYLPISLESLKKFREIKEIIVILDRCTDSSEAIVKEKLPNAKIIKKEHCRWKNSYAENLQIGYKCSTGGIICIHDADIKCDNPEFFKILVMKLKGNVASVSPVIRTCKGAGFLNLLTYYWEKTRWMAPLGEKPRGGLRLIRRECLEKIGGFRDVLAPDTQLDVDLKRAGYASILCKEVYAWHLRKITLRRAISAQINAGRARRELHQPLWLVLGHSVLRMRPFVLYGYLKGEKK
jgi:glycosyltransferase involved in cell wall biosynthesis